MIKIKYEDFDGTRCANLQGRMYTIVDEGRGVREKFWMKRQGSKNVNYFEPPRLTRLLFKYNRNEVSCEDWGEVYMSKICDRVGVGCVPYYIAQLQDEKGQVVGRGVMCGSYKKSHAETEFSVYDLQTKGRTTGDGFDIPNMNTVKGTIDAIKEHFSGFEEEEIEKCRNDLIKQAIMDFLLCQTDRHWLNTTILVYDVMKKPHLRKSSCYDNGCIAMLKRKISAIEGMSKEIGKLGKDSPYLEEKLSSYCPMFGIDTSLVEINKEKNKPGQIEKIKVVNPKKSREIFLKECVREILTNPEIASFFNSLKSHLKVTGEHGVDIDDVTKQIRRGGDDVPPCVAKMIGDVFYHQFDVLNGMVKKRLKEIKDQEKELYDE
ncbi:MAG: hypothetical protein IJW59_01465 [Clostridia bacterium]|nr:hypothetical protein [Clostridia bacterium]